MTSNALRKSVTHAFIARGFSPIDRVLFRTGDGVTMVVGFDRGFEHQWYISIGFWLHGLGAEVPSVVEKTHLYFRLDRLVPQLREVVLMAGSLADKRQPEALGQLIDLISSDVGTMLESLLTIEGLTAALKAHALDSGLVTKEARAYLTG